MNNKISVLVLIVFCVSLNVTAQNVASAQNLKASRGLYQNILKTIKNDVKEKYYDADLRGVDIESNAQKASKLIDKAMSVEELSDIIARFLYPFDDSHLFFLPPKSTITVSYGWEMMFIGDKVFVTEVDDDSDAQKKGVKVGDQIYMVEGYIPTRQEFSFLRYHFNILRPQPSLNVILIKPGGNKFKVNIKAKITEDNVFLPTTRDLYLQSEREYLDSVRQSFHDKIPGLSIWKMPNFDLTPIKVDKMMDKVKKSEALILDLRGNSGGYEVSLGQLTANFFGEEMKIGQIKGRKGIKNLILKPENKKNFIGKLVVLIDSDSASAAEIFARIVQLEKRGTVIGDQSAGAVMRSEVITYEFGIDTLVIYGISLTVSDLVMRDGQRLEKIGVTPDEKLWPTALDLANQRDPVLARAAEILGFKMTSEQAGKIFDKKK